MVALTDVAFPGYFRPRTYILGRYFGIEIDGQLIAMAGERLALPGYREISAVCTHPAHTGKGYAATLIQHLMRIHAAAGLRSFLHVSQSNQRAIALYERLGYKITPAPSTSMASVAFSAVNKRTSPQPNLSCYRYPRQSKPRGSPCSAIPSSAEAS